MYNVFINISLIVLSLFSAVANSSQCLVNQGNSSYLIDGSKDFCMTFTVKADGRNRVRVKLDRYYKPIWTDQLQFKNNAIFYEDEYLNDPNKHEFQIQFTRNSAGSGYIYGTLRYYIDGKLKKEQSNFNLTSFAKVTTGNPFFILQAPTYPLNQPNKLCVTPISCTITSSFPTDAHYEFGVHKCNSMPCDIPITRTDYRNAPLVFVMPTIDTVHPDQDAPSRLYISSELKKGSTSFTISQHSLPSLSNRFDEKPMTEISYFIMEPGATIIDGHKVIAGFLETDKVNRKHDSVESIDTNFSNFDIGFKGYNEEPVILHQIQTNNNKSAWMTSGRHWNGQDRKRKVALFLEQSFSNDSRIKKEKIAFLATEPSDRLNVTDSNVGAHLLEFKLASTHQQPDNLNIPCNNMIATTNLQISGIILNKQQRQGPDGGWLRRCKIQGNQASVVVDENNRVRSHTTEIIGYLAFEKIVPPTLPKVCDYVPEGLQTNNIDSNGKPKGKFQVYWNAVIYPEKRNPKYSLKYVNHAWGLTCLYPGASNVEYCIDNNRDTGFYDPNKIHPALLNKALNDYNVTGNPDVICGTSGVPKTCDIPSGRYKDISLQEHGTLRLQGGEYWLNELSFGRYSKMEVLAPSVVHYKKLTVTGDGVQINQAGKANAHDLLFIGHERPWNQTHISGNNKKINAFLYSSSDVYFYDSNTEFRGGITANNIIMNAWNMHFYPQNCQATPVVPKITQLKIKPNNYHLTCENDDKKVVEVQMLDKDGNLVMGAQPSLTLIQEGGTNLNITQGSQKDGVAQFKVATIQPSTVGEYDLKASLTVNGTVLTDSVKIKYVPYKFAVANQQVVAGKKNTVSITVKACSQDGKVVTTGYTGQPSVDFTYLSDSLKHPAVKDIRDLEFAPQFGGGSTSAEMRFKESGKIKVTVRDANFTCDPTQYRCPMNGGALKGEFEVIARPWKIAICDIKSKSDSKVINPATKESGKGFIASGETFVASYRPVIHPDSSGGYQPCDSNYPITNNYGLDNGPLGIVHDAVYPTSSSASMGELAPSNPPDAFDKDHRTYTFEHSWNEVGTMRITTSAKYLGMNLDVDTQEVGRFYPKYFNVVNSTVWDYPGKQSYAYMNQPFEGVTFYVEALNEQGRSVNNYGYFDPTITANFALYEANPAFTNRFYSGTPSKSWASISGKSIGTFTLGENSPSTNCSRELCWAKATPADGYEDGPFNTAGGTGTSISIDAVGSNIDPVDYQKSSGARLLTVQPIIRFGRAVMDSVGGVSGGGMNIPLRIEHWTGTGFAIHDGDNTSNIRGVNIESTDRDIWVETGATASEVNLAGGGGVVNGASNSIHVAQVPTDPEVRQQTQVWLELNGGGNTAPWLRYRWQDANRVEVNGEEDPSAIVTFGIYRGNDRVIYRGETGLFWGNN